MHHERPWANAQGLSHSTNVGMVPKGAGLAVLDFEDALRIVLSEARHEAGLALETLPLLECAGRVLAEPLVADRDQPPFDRSTRDGFALHSHASATQYRVMGEVRAGQTWSGPSLGPGEAVAIMTGAPLPPGADSVVMVEHVEREGETLRLEAGRTFAPGDNIVRRGSEARAGEQVLLPGVRIGCAEIALAAMLRSRDIARLRPSARRHTRHGR